MMRIMRTIIVVSLLIGGLTIAGCDDDNNTGYVNSSVQPDNTKEEGGGIELEENMHVLDSINVLTSRLDTLGEAQRENAQSIANIDKELSELKGASHLIDLISWIVVAIAVVIAVVSLVKLSSINGRANRHRKAIEELSTRINLLEHKSANIPARAKTTYSGLSNSEYDKLASRIGKIERQLDKQSQDNTIAPQNVSQARHLSDIQRFNNEQKGYFSLPTQMSLTEAYFKRLSDTRDSDSRFTVVVRDNNAEFKPIEGTQYLNEIKSNDAIKMALEIQGCLPTEANLMRVLMPGEAKKMNGRWVITKKATIYLQR